MPFGSTQSSTPATGGSTLVQGLVKGANYLGIGRNASFGGGTLIPSSPISTSQVPQASFSLSPMKPTASGGISFNPNIATAVSAPVHPATVQTPASLGNYLNNTSSTPNGGQVTVNGTGVSNYTPSPGYSIDTSGAVPSAALSSNLGLPDLQQKQASYQDLINGVSQAQGYDQNYIQALQGQYGAQTQGAQLGLNSAALNSNYYTGNNLPGDTLNYAQGATAKAQAQNTLEQAQNSIQQLSANQALNTQQLARTGNIAAAQTQLQYNPVAMSAQNAINQYNSLQQQYPAANIPGYNTALSPALNQQIGQELVANSPAYKSQFQSTYQTPGGGTGLYSKLDLSGLQQNQDGTYTLVPGAAAALGSANASVVNNSLNNLSTINAAIDSSTKTLDTTTKFMQQYGLNDSNTPIITQIQNRIKDQTTQRGAIAGLNADLNTLRSDYSQFLIGRGGSVAGTGPNSPEVLQAIPDNISASQLKLLVGQMQQDGQNTADAVSSQVNQALQGISSNSVGSSNGATQGGSIWSF